MEYARKIGKKIITYMWSLAPIGSLEFEDFRDLTRQDKLHQYITASYNRSLKLSDKIFCRNQTAKEVIVGSLISLGRINLADYKKFGSNFDYLAEIAPFGILSSAAKHKQDIYRGVIPGINQDDFILLWNGGVWNRTDSPGMAEIMKHIWPKSKKIKLVLQGFYNPHQIYSREAKQMMDKVKKYGLLHKNVFIPEQWIEFSERGNYLTEANVGITLSPNIPDANYFIKTRFYDYLWAELPIILNEYESFAREVEKYKLGLVLTGDYDKQAEEIVKFVRNKKLQAEIKGNIRKYKQGKGWEDQLAPVISYCKELN